MTPVMLNQTQNRLGVGRMTVSSISNVIACTMIHQTDSRFQIYSPGTALRPRVTYHMPTRTGRRLTVQQKLGEVMSLVTGSLHVKKLGREKHPATRPSLTMLPLRQPLIGHRSPWQP